MSASQILDRFPFDHVAQFMEETNWQWHRLKVKTVPKREELMSVAGELLLAVAIQERPAYQATGGLHARHHSDGRLSLQFQGYRKGRRIDYLVIEQGDGL